MVKHITKCVNEKHKFCLKRNEVSGTINYLKNCLFCKKCDHMYDKTKDSIKYKYNIKGGTEFVLIRK